MGYVEKILEPNERLRRWGRLHWVIYLRAWLGFSLSVVLFLVAGSFAAVNQKNDATILIIIGLIVFIASTFDVLVAWIRRVTTEIAVTDFRIILKTGLIRRSTIEINALRVESVDVKQSIVGRILGFGTVEVRGTGIGLEPLTRIAGPLGLRRAVQAAHQSTLRGVPHGQAVN